MIIFQVRRSTQKYLSLPFVFEFVFWSLSKLYHMRDHMVLFLCLVSVFGFVFVFVFGALPLSFCLYLILSLCLYLCMYLMLSVKSDGRSPCALSWFDICF